VPIEPFSLPDDDEEIETALILEGIALPSVDLFDLAGKRFDFPVNPALGYIDGSISVSHAHHPVDVKALRFGELADGKLSVEIEAAIDFGFEGFNDYGRTVWTCSTSVSPE